MLHFGMNMPYYLMMLYGSIMIVMVLILRGLFRNRLPKFVFPVLWCVVLARFVIPFSVSSPLSLPIPWNYLSPIQITYTVDGDSATEATVVEDVPVFEFTAGDAQTVGYDNVKTLITYTYDAVTEDVSIQTEDWTDYAYGSIFNKFFTGQRILFVIYILGIAAVAGILGWQKFRYLKRLQTGLLIENNETINSMLRDMGMGHVLVFSNDEIASPIVYGLFNPRIYLPTKMDFRNTMLLRHVLVHETMHIRRKDNWIKCVMLVVLCLNWFNPLVWMMTKYLASDLEAACDAAVIRQCGEEEKKDYAYSLLAMAVSGSRTSLLYSAFSKSEVEKRMKNILSYKKMTALVLLFTVLLMAGRMTAFASIGQAPFWNVLTDFCSSDNSKWGVEVTLTREIALGKDAQKRAEDIVFSVLETDETHDPKVIEDRILTELAQEFGVERRAFHVKTSFTISNEKLREDYEPWGLSAEQGTTFWKYNGRTIRTYEDKMVGSYQSNTAGTVDVTVIRNDFGDITAVEALQEGDPEYDKRTREIEREKSRWSDYGIDTDTANIMQVTTVIEAVQE